MSEPMAIEVNAILKASGARIPVGLPDAVVRGAFVDSRAVVEGGLFVGLRGERADGGRYAEQALKRGAAAAVVTESSFRWIAGDVAHLRKPVLVAKDPLEVLQVAGRIALERTGAKVIGITGAVGKTTTKDILVAMLAAAGARVAGSAGNRNTEIGVPLSLLDMAEDTEVAVIEMGMRGPGQIAELARLAPPIVGCITAIGPVHLELLGTVENVAAAKAELIAALPAGGTAVVPEVEPLLDPHIAALSPEVRVLRFGSEPDVALDIDLPTAWLKRNAAAALACCRAIGHEPAPGTRVEVRLSPLRAAESPLAVGGLLIEDCYNANPIAMVEALRDLTRREGRTVAVLADMRELGPDEERFHHEVGALAAELDVGLLVAVGTLGAGYAAGAAGRVPTLTYATVEDCAADLAAHLAPGDVVLLKGSRGMALERVGEGLKAAAS